MYRIISIVLYVFSILIGFVLFVLGHPPVPINYVVALISLVLGAAGIAAGLGSRT